MALLKILTQAAVTGGKAAFKAYAKKNKIPFNSNTFAKHLQSKGYESPFRKDSEKLTTTIQNYMRNAKVPGRTTKETGLLGGAKDPKTGARYIPEDIKNVLSEKRLEAIAAGKGLNLPPPKLRGAKRKWVPQLDAYIRPYTSDRGVHEVMEQALRRDKQRGLLDIAFGKGTPAKIENKQKKFLKQFQKNLIDDEFMDDYLRAATPYGKKAERYFKEDFSKLSTNKEYVEVVRNYLKSRGYSDEEIAFLMKTRFATTGHIPPVKESYADWLGFGNKASLEAFEQSANPRMWNPEFGLVNIAKGTSDPWIFKAAQKNKLSPEGLEQARHMYDAFGIKSLIRGKPIGTHNLERQANLIDWATGTPYQTKLFTGRPGTTDVDKARRMFKRMLERGDIT